MPKIKTAEEKLLDVQFTSSAPTELSSEAENLARQLSQIHGTIRVAAESSGVHFYMASPACLMEDGDIELTKMHLAVNVEKYMVTGEAYVAMCMKTGESYSIHDLLAMPPLDQRGFEHKPSVIIQKDVNAEHLEEDAYGNMVPKSPGEVIPILDLPADHPAIMYLNRRNFDLQSLTDQFQVAYCTKERNDVFYARMSNGFRATSQGRIVFYIVQDGIVQGWQARILELEHEGKIFYWHPYKNKWTAVSEVNPGGKPLLLPGWEEWDPHKYIIGSGTQRNKVLMGYDTALAYNEHRSLRYGILAEGALDVGRYGPPGMAMLGKFLSPGQAELLKRARFQKLLFVRDMDEVGGKALEKVQYQLASVGLADTLVPVEPPAGFKDLGEVTDNQFARDYVDSFL